METVVKWFSRNHVAGNFLMLAVLLGIRVVMFGYKKLRAQTPSR